MTLIQEMLRKSDVYSRDIVEKFCDKINNSDEMMKLSTLCKRHEILGKSWFWSINFVFFKMCKIWKQIWTFWWNDKNYYVLWKKCNFIKFLDKSDF